jgi:hypothetical protein
LCFLSFCDFYGEPRGWLIFSSSWLACDSRKYCGQFDRGISRLLAIYHHLSLDLAIYHSILTSALWQGENFLLFAEGIGCQISIPVLRRRGMALAATFRCFVISVCFVFSL